MTLAEQIRSLYGRYGDWDQGGIDRAQELADLLQKQGITDVSQIRLLSNTRQEMQNIGGESDGQMTLVETPINQVQFGDRTLGFVGDYNNDDTFGSNVSDYLQEGNVIAWSARGKGNVKYRIGTDAQGNTYLAPEWNSSSDMDTVRDLGKFALMAAGLHYGLPMLSGAEGAGLFGTESVLGSAGIGGAEGAAFADLAGGLIPEFGTTAAYNAAIAPAVAGTALSAAPLSTTVGAPLAELTSGGLVTGTGAPAILSEAAISSLTPAIASGAISPSVLSRILPSILTAAATPGLLTSGQGPQGALTAPTQGVPTSSPDYYRAVQQYYNAYMPNAPRDVAGPLQQWYDNSYGTPTSQPTQPPGVSAPTQPNVGTPGRPTMRPMSAGGAQTAQQPAPTQSPNQILFNEYMSGYQNTGGFDDRSRQVLGLLSQQNPDLFAAFTADPTLYNAAYGGKYSSISPERQEALQRAAPKKEQALTLQRILARNSDIDFENPAAVANAFSDLGQQAQLYLATGMSPESAGLLRSYAQPLRGAALAGDLAAGRLNYDQAMDISRYQDAQQLQTQWEREIQNAQEWEERFARDIARYQADLSNPDIAGSAQSNIDSLMARQAQNQAGLERLQQRLQESKDRVARYAPTFTGVDMTALDYNRLNTPQDIIDFAQRAGVGTQASSLFTPTGG